MPYTPTDVILNEIKNGDYDNFRSQLGQEYNLKLETVLSPGHLEHIAKALQGTNVKIVDLSDNYIGNQGACVFTKNLQSTNNVETIILSYNGIGPKGAAELVRNLSGTNVKIVDLSGNLIDQGTADLAKNLQSTKVESIDLSHSNIGNQGAIDFAENLPDTTLTNVNLQGNNITSKGVVGFAKKLNRTTQVTTVDFSNNNLDQNEIDFRTIFQGIVSISLTNERYTGQAVLKLEHKAVAYNRSFEEGRAFFELFKNQDVVLPINIRQSISTCLHHRPSQTNFFYAAWNTSQQIFNKNKKEAERKRKRNERAGLDPADIISNESILRNNKKFKPS